MVPSLNFIAALPAFPASFLAQHAFPLFRTFSPSVAALLDCSAKLPAKDLASSPTAGLTAGGQVWSARPKHLHTGTRHGVETLGSAPDFIADL